MFFGLYQDLVKEALRFLADTEEAVYEDKYLRFETTASFRGPFYSCDEFKPTYKITNKQSVPLVIPKIKFYYINENVQGLVGIPEMEHGSFYITTYENPAGGYFLPHESKETQGPGPQFIPHEVHVVISHSATTTETEFNLQLSEEKDIEYWTSPKHLDFELLDIGIDGLEAFNRCKARAEALVGPADLAMAIPMKTTTRKQGNGLDIVSIFSWSLLFASHNGREGAWISIDSAGCKGSVIDRRSDSDNADLMKRTSSLPIRVGSYQALQILQRENLIFGNTCQGLWLEPDGLVDGIKRPIWKTPYVGRDYMTLWVDAYNGDVLSLDLDFQQSGKGPPWRFNVEVNNQEFMAKDKVAADETTEDLEVIPTPRTRNIVATYDISVSGSELNFGISHIEPIKEESTHTALTVSAFECLRPVSDYVQTELRRDRARLYSILVGSGYYTVDDTERWQIRTTSWYLCFQDGSDRIEVKCGKSREYEEPQILDTRFSTSYPDRPPISLSRLVVDSDHVLRRMEESLGISFSGLVLEMADVDGKSTPLWRVFSSTGLHALTADKGVSAYPANTKASAWHTQ